MGVSVVIFKVSGAVVSVVYAQSSCPVIAAGFFRSNAYVQCSWAWDGMISGVLGSVLSCSVG